MEILKIKEKNREDVFAAIVKIIKKGGVVISPTDTVYGLICDAKNGKAVRKIFKIKERGWQKPLSLFVKNLEMAREVARINKTQEDFLKKVWPGQTIAIFFAKKRFPKGVVSESGKIGLRIPDYKLLNILLKKFDSPLAQTSANISSKPSVREIKEVLRQFQKKNYLPDLILNGGKLKSKKPSQVVDLTPKKPKIIRE